MAKYLKSGKIDKVLPLFVIRTISTISGKFGCTYTNVSCSINFYLCLNWLVQPSEIFLCKKIPKSSLKGAYLWPRTWRIFTPELVVSKTGMSFWRIFYHCLHRNSCLFDSFRCSDENFCLSVGFHNPLQHMYALQWRHNERDGVSNHQPHYCLLNCLFRRRSNKTSKLRVTGQCEGNSSVTGEFPTQGAINAENVSIWWRHLVCATSHHINQSWLNYIINETLYNYIQSIFWRNSEYLEELSCYWIHPQWTWMATQSKALSTVNTICLDGCT